VGRLLLEDCPRVGGMAATEKNKVESACGRCLKIVGWGGS